MLLDSPRPELGRLDGTAKDGQRKHKAGLGGARWAGSHPSGPRVRQGPIFPSLSPRLPDGTPNPNPLPSDRSLHPLPVTCPSLPLALSPRLLTRRRKPSGRMRRPSTPARHARTRRPGPVPPSSKTIDAVGDGQVSTTDDDHRPLCNVTTHLATLHKPGPFADLWPHARARALNPGRGPRRGLGASALNLLFSRHGSRDRGQTMCGVSRVPSPPRSRARVLTGLPGGPGSPGDPGDPFLPWRKRQGVTLPSPPPGRPGAGPRDREGAGWGGPDVTPPAVRGQRGSL